MSRLQRSEEEWTAHEHMELEELQKAREVLFNKYQRRRLPWEDVVQIDAMIEEAVELEIAYAQDCLPRGILGLNAGLFREYVQHIADRRLERIGLAAKYGSSNPFPWMSETIDLAKEKNFFETRVTEYQTASALSW